MKNRKILNLLSAVVIAVMAITFTACSSNDDNNDGTPPNVDPQLVTDKTPAKGWSGDLQNGIATYCYRIVDNSDAKDERDIEPQTYYAFSFSNSLCQNAVFNIVFSNENMATEMESLFRSGQWANQDGGDDDDDDDYNEGPWKSRQFISLTRAANKESAITNINWQDLSLPVFRSGKVLYFKIEGLNGKNSNDVQDLVNYWTDQSKVNPQTIIFGQWDNNANRYTNNHLLGLNINYVIQMAFSNDQLTSYVTTITFPNRTFAEMMYDELIRGNDQFAAKYGIRPEASINGNVVKENAVIFGEVSKAQTLELIASIDWNMSIPFITKLYD